MTPLPLWILIAGAVLLAAASGSAGFAAGWWAGDTSQLVETKNAEIRAAEARAAAKAQELAVAEATGAELVKQIAILEQTNATGALLAAKSARDEAEAKERADELETAVAQARADLVAARSKRAPAGKCPCIFTDADMRSLRSIEDRGRAAAGAGGKPGHGAQGAGSSPSR